MPPTRRMSLKIQIALLAGVTALAGALSTSLLPPAVFWSRDAIFEAMLPAAALAQLEAAREQFGKCHPRYIALLSELGFDAWRLNYLWVISALGTAASLLTAVLAWRAAAYVAAPIESLARAARRVAAGCRDTAEAPSSTASAEVQTLHADFARMTMALKAADEDLRLRSAALAHDIRTPLTIMQGRLVGLQEHIFKADAAFIAGLLQQVAFIDHLVSEINALSDARSAHASDAVAMDWSALTRQSLAALEPEFSAAQIEVMVRIEDAVVVRADPVRVSRALLNVFRNSLRYAHGAPLRVSLRRQGKMALLLCEDGGPGWPVADPMTLAKPFARGDSSRSADTGGSGLGLSIVQAVAVVYGGQLRLLRAETGGALVELSLPLATS